VSKRKQEENMKTLENYLDDLKEKTGSDNKSAKELGIDRSAVSNIRRRNLISDETAIRLADALKIDRTEILIAAAIARSEGEVKKAWENISKRTGIAASIFISASLSAQWLEALLWMAEKAGNKGILYIM
jgi:transcriptional regulator with XRE-family HTH domain